MTRRRTIATLIAVFTVFLIAAFAFAACDFGTQNREQVRTTEMRFMIDTYVEITIYHNIHESAPASIMEGAFDLVEQLENLMSITIEGSDVYRINNAHGEATAVDPATIEVISKSIEFGELSAGLFDITVGRLSRLWNFSENEEIPEGAALAETHATVDFRQISIFDNTVTLANADAWIDLGAIAKGYIADRVADFLIENGVSSAMINLGGDIRLVGDRGDGNPWRLAIRNPFDYGDEPHVAVLEVSSAAVVSSGTYERRFEVDGVWYHHILDPKTAMPAISDVVSVTVIAQSGIAGEGLATIAILKGSEAAVEILESHSEFIGAVFILDDGEMLEIGDVRLTN